MSMILAKYKLHIISFLIFLFTFLSFLPTIHDLSLSNKLYDQNREFILEHNYYWPDFNLYLSKIRQGQEGKLFPKELYSSEPHSGSLIQIFYSILGMIGKIIGLDPNFSYQLGRLMLTPILLLVIFLLTTHVFKNSLWQIIGFITIVVSSSFPKFTTGEGGQLIVQRYMEWWSNIDSLQRIAFIPHILFGQIVSFLVFYFLLKKNWIVTSKDILIYAIVGNILGLIFPPSLITLNSVIILFAIIKIIKTRNLYPHLYLIFFVLVSLLSQIYIWDLTRQIPWIALVHVHRINHMLIPFTEYLLALGPVVILAFIGIIVSLFQKDKKMTPFILWIVVSFFYSIVFTHYKEQSPLRFTQGGIHIPLGILGYYAIFQSLKIFPKTIIYLFLILYFIENLFILKLSWDWQYIFNVARARANIPPVAYPPQTVHPLKKWMDAMRFLRENTRRDDVIVAEISAGNHIPAYAGNTVYFGQVNTYDYDRKYALVQKFFTGLMTWNEAQVFLRTGRIRYIFFGPQERERASNKNLAEFYPFLKPVYQNDAVTIYAWY